MKLEHKIGIAITCTFLCLVGAVIGLKMQEQTPPASPSVAAADSLDSVTPIREAKIAFDDKEPMHLPIPDNSGLQSPHPDRKEKTPSDKVQKTPKPSQETTPPPPEKTPSVKSASASKKKPATDKPNPTTGAASVPSSPPTLEDVERDLSGLGKTPPPHPVETTPTSPPVKGAGEWGKFSSGSGENKQGAAPAAPANDRKTASSSPPQPASEATKKQQAANKPAPAIILPMGGIDTPKSPEPPAISAAAPPSPPTPPLPLPENAPSLTPAAASKPAPVTSPSGSGMPPYLQQKSTIDPPKNDPKPKESISPPPLPAPEKLPAKPQTSPTPALPSTPAATPSTVPPPTMPPPRPSTPPPAPASPLMRTPTAIGADPHPAPAPVPAAPPASPSIRTPTPIVVDPHPIPAPASVPPATPPAPPKPPTDGSSFIPDSTSAAPGSVGVKPAPLPLPTLPSSPLASAPLKPAPQRPASNRPSVTVYDEQDYACRPGDSWEEISKRFYMTDRYAKALQRHNQSHARASDLMRDTGRVAPGERIFVPQSYVLEERYADAIPKPAAAPAPATMPATFVSPGNPPPPHP